MTKFGQSWANSRQRDATRQSQPRPGLWRTDQNEIDQLTSNVPCCVPVPRPLPRAEGVKGPLSPFVRAIEALDVAHEGLETIPEGRKTPSKASLKRAKLLQNL